MTAVLSTIGMVGYWLSPVSWILYCATYLIASLAFRSVWMFCRQELYKRKMNWVNIEIKVPREILRGPKAMDQFFSALFPLGNFPESPVKKFWVGEVPRYHVMELLGKNNELRIFMRLNAQLKDAIEGLLYAQYPNIEIYALRWYQ